MVVIFQTKASSQRFKNKEYYQRLALNKSENSLFRPTILCVLLSSLLWYFIRFHEKHNHSSNIFFILKFFPTEAFSIAVISEKSFMRGNIYSLIFYSLNLICLAWSLIFQWTVEDFLSDLINIHWFLH